MFTHSVPLWYVPVGQVQIPGNPELYSVATCDAVSAYGKTERSS